MKELIFILTVMNGDTAEGEIVYPNMDKCKWYAEKINTQKANLILNYSAWCKPVVRDKPEE